MNTLKNKPILSQQIILYYKYITKGVGVDI